MFAIDWDGERQPGPLARRGVDLQIRIQRLHALPQRAQGGLAHQALRVDAHAVVRDHELEAVGRCFHADVHLGRLGMA